MVRKVLKHLMALFRFETAKKLISEASETLKKILKLLPSKRLQNELNLDQKAFFKVSTNEKSVAI